MSTRKNIQTLDYTQIDREARRLRAEWLSSLFARRQR